VYLIDRSFPWFLLLVACTAHAPSTTSGEPARAPASAALAPEAPAATSDPDPRAAEALALPAASEPTPGPFVVRIDKGKIQPPSKPYPVEPHDESMQDHVWTAGWTEDGSAFAYCRTDTECDLCTFVGLDGRETERLQTGGLCDKKAGKVFKRKAFEAALAERKVAVRDVDWQHGSLVVTERHTTGKPDSFGERRATVEIGAAPQSSTAPGVTAWQADGCARDKEGEHCFVEAHADVVAPSPDGQHVAVLAHMWAGEWSDTFALEIIPAGRLAAAGYNRAGLDALAAGRLEEAADAFVAATHADPEAWKGPYNLACAYARVSDARAQVALRTAVERGGAAVRKKAGTDEDLDAVRDEAWFSELVTP
jgi:hypothetical protein